MSTSSNTSTVSLPERVDISVVSEIYLTLSGALEGDKAIVLDASAVERIDASGLQLLLAFILQASTQEISCSWFSPSAALIRSAQLIGLLEPLALEEY